jgi:hypothetical protein
MNMKPGNFKPIKLEWYGVELIFIWPCRCSSFHSRRSEVSQKIVSTGQTRHRNNRGDRPWRIPLQPSRRSAQNIVHAPGSDKKADLKEN